MVDSLTLSRVRLGSAGAAAPAGGSPTAADDSLAGFVKKAGSTVDKKVSYIPSSDVGKPRKHKSGALAIIAEDEGLAGAALPADVVRGAVEMSADIHAAVEARVRKGTTAAAKAIAASHNVYVCFLMDTTGSMGPYMREVKDRIAAVVDLCRKMGCAIDGIAFVGYKDWCDGVDHFQRLPFTTDVARFKAFVTGVTATGGGDTPEDVLGGMREALRLSWPDNGSTKILFHIADAPPHGRVYGTGYADDHPSGHSSDPTPESLFSTIHEKGIIYNFARIGALCDKMIEIFSSARCYGQPVPVFGLLDATTLSSAITSSIAKSVEHTSSAAGKGKPKDRRIRPHVIIATGTWDFARYPALKADLLEPMSPTTDVIDYIVSGGDFELKRSRTWVKVAPNPFAKGACRLAYRGRQLFPRSKLPDGVPATEANSVVENVILKERILLPTSAALDKHRYLTDLDTQTVASELAFDFNAAAKELSLTRFKIKFLIPQVVSIYLPDGSKRYMALEHEYRDGVEMMKFTNNFKYVRPKEADATDAAIEQKIAAAVAYSHFTYAATGGHLLVCDLQGIFTHDDKSRETLLLTDPAIHCPTQLRFGETNLRQRGIDAFFETHVCNNICRGMGLHRCVPVGAGAAAAAK